MVTADGRSFEVSGGDFYARIVLGDSFGKIGNSQANGKRTWFKRNRIFFPASAIIEGDGQILGRITSWVFKHKIEFENGEKFFLSHRIFKSSIVMKDSRGELILEKRMPKITDRGIGEVLVYQPNRFDELDKLVPVLFYAPVLSQGAAFIFLWLGAAVNLINVFRLISL
ncbi:MAG: hypothetical protein ACKOE6_02110 [Flammeovirgaceae bacterium]